MPEQDPSAESPETAPESRKRWRPTDSYGLVLFLIVLDYFALSTIVGTAWGRVATIVLLGLTLLFTLRTSRSHRIWQLLATIYLIASALYVLIAAFVPSGKDIGPVIIDIGGLLLLVTPFVILRRIITHKFVTIETLLGAICVYLLFGFSCAFIFSALGLFSPTPFFSGYQNATLNDYLFFSYTTLTTVGYGNLVPAGNLGRAFAVMEALFGQIYLVIVVARLVSLWGQELPPSRRERRNGA